MNKKKRLEYLEMDR